MKAQSKLDVKRDQVFISYSHKDKKWLEKLQTMLKPLMRNNTISVWDDTKIQTGDRWREEIEKALATANVAVLMVSANFLASDFIAKHELPPLLKAAKQQGLTIIWVPVSFCLVGETEIKEYQAVHNPSQPLESLKGAKLNQILVKICQEIKIKAAVTEPSRTPLDSPLSSPDNASEGLNQMSARINRVTSTQQPTGLQTQPTIETYEQIELDLTFEIPLTSSEMLNGTKKRIQVQNESLDVTIPAGISSGKRLRLRGKGNVNPHTLERGNLYLRVIKFQNISQNTIDDLGDDLSSERRVDYTYLRDLLADGRWMEADHETLVVLLKAAGEDYFLGFESIEKLPYTDLRTIDKLWVKYSDGRFGFSIQKRVWIQCGGLVNTNLNAEEGLCNQVGWQKNNSLLNYSELNFLKNAPIGHLPAAWYFHNSMIFALSDINIFLSRVRV